MALLCYNLLMTWALKRQIFYIIVLVLVVLIFGYLILSPVINKTQSCIDGIQNGGETGIDCGGSCAKACLAQVDQVSVLWARSFRVIEGRYNAVAYLENQNRNVAVNKINYRFRFADANNIYIGKREGSTFIPSSGKFAIFEPGIDIGHSIPVYTTLEFTEVPQWVSVPSLKVNQLQLLVSNISLIGENLSPFLSATLKNNSLFTIPDIKVVAILYDINHNAVSASSTYLDSLGAEEEKDLNFTWPEPFSRQIVAKEIIPMYNIFSVTLR